MSSTIPTTTSTPSILNFFKRKSETPDSIPDKRIRCPACHILVGKAALNSHLDNDCKSKSNGGDNEDGNETSKNDKDDDNGAFSSSDESDFADAASSIVEAVYSASSQSSAEGDSRRDRRESEPPATPKRYDFESCAPRRFDE